MSDNKLMPFHMCVYIQDDVQVATTTVDDKAIPTSVDNTDPTPSVNTKTEPISPVPDDVDQISTSADHFEPTPVDADHNNILPPSNADSTEPIHLCTNNTGSISINNEPIPSSSDNADPMDASPEESISINTEPIPSSTDNADAMDASPDNVEPIHSTAVDSNPLTIGIDSNTTPKDVAEPKDDDCGYDDENNGNGREYDKIQAMACDDAVSMVSIDTSDASAMASITQSASQQPSPSQLQPPSSKEKTHARSAHNREKKEEYVLCY